MPVCSILRELSSGSPVRPRGPVVSCWIQIGTTMGILWHTFVVRTWVVTLYGTMVVAKVAELGHVLPRRTPTGEVLSVSSGDSDVFGAVLEVTERTFAAFGAFLLLVWLMISTSPKLGLIVLIASPLLVASSFFLLRPLHHAQEVERKRSSELTSRVTDIVAGLRILAGLDDVVDGQVRQRERPRLRSRQWAE